MYSIGEEQSATSLPASTIKKPPLFLTSQLQFSYDVGPSIVREVFEECIGRVYSMVHTCRNFKYIFSMKRVPLLLTYIKVPWLVHSSVWDPLRFIDVSKDNMF